MTECAIPLTAFIFIRQVIVSVLWLTVIACATTNLPSLTESEHNLQMDEDEKRAWKNTKELENQIERAGLLYQNPSLEEYLQSIADRLIPPSTLPVGTGLQIKIIRNPFLNAFALPDGVVYIHTGMLARMENEAQLATILGHELTHFTHRHAIKEMRNAENKSLLRQTVRITLTIVAGQLGSILGAPGNVWTLASIRGYSRDLETEADVEGLKLMVSAGYDAREAPKIFEFLGQELDKEKMKEPFFFGTHPRLQERIDNYRALLNSYYASQLKEGERLRKSEGFLSQTAPLLLDNAVLDINIGRLETAQAAIEKHLKQQPLNPRAHFLLGEVHRHSGNSDIFTARALDSYQEAAQLDLSFAEPHRELGLLFRKQKREKEARVEFERYLSLNPQAVDKQIIKGFLSELATP
jgi:beta-barrel assembly-enhancing protease